jgi:hypothetical protein
MGGGVGKAREQVIAVIADIARDRGIGRPKPTMEGAKISSDPEVTPGLNPLSP